MKLKWFYLLMSWGLLATDLAQAQDRLLTGRVTGANDNTPLPGVNVLIKGTAIGTSTDAEGNYRLNVS
ncbi:MAG: carboxypeptidase-like regulatory domain-containing protein, partial [Runella sp.]